MRRLLFFVGLAAGYVLGARAGRSTYDALVAKARGAASSPAVQDAVDKASAAVEKAAPKATAAVGSIVETAGGVAGAAKGADGSADETGADERGADDSGDADAPAADAAAEATAPEPQPAALEPGAPEPIALTTIDDAATSITPDALDESTSPTATS